MDPVQHYLKKCANRQMAANPSNGSESVNWAGIRTRDDAVRCKGMCVGPRTVCELLEKSATITSSTSNSALRLRDRKRKLRAAAKAAAETAAREGVAS